MWEEIRRRIQDGTLYGYLMKIKPDSKTWFDMVDPDTDFTLLQMVAQNRSKNAFVFSQLLSRGFETLRASSHDYVIIQQMVMDGMEIHTGSFCFMLHPQKTNIIELCILNGYTIDTRIGWVESLRRRFVAHRRKIVILLGLKRRRIQQMVHLDRFLVRELALRVWSGRYQLE